MKLPGDLRVLKCAFGHFFPAYTAIYILTGKRLALIDSGFSDTPSKWIFPYFEKNNMSVKDIALVINSHAMSDHAGGNGEVKERTGAQIATHKLDVKWVEDHEVYFREFYAAHPQQYRPTQVCKATVLRNYGREVKVDMQLDDGDIVEAGDRKLEVIHTPGHSYGSMCLYDRSDRILFTGDAIQGRNNRVGPCLLDVDLYMESLQRISALDIDIMCTAHVCYPAEDTIVTGKDVRTLISESMKCTKEYEAYVIEFLENAKEPQDLGEIGQYANSRHPSLHSHPMFPLNHLPLGTTYAHLQSLKNQGRVLFDERSETWQIK